jgi:EF hand
MRKVLCLAALLGLFALVAGTAGAADEKKGDKKGQLAGLLKGGKISLDDFKKQAKEKGRDEAKAEALFKRLDANKDGFLTADELKAARDKAGQRKKKKNDK